MVPALSLSIAVYLFALTLWGLALSLVGRPPDRTYLLATLLGEAEVLVHALIGGIGIAAGHRPGSMGEFLGYLLVSIMLIPFVLQLARAGSTRWDSLTIGAVCLAVGVAVIRMMGLW